MHNTKKKKIFIQEWQHLIESTQKDLRQLTADIVELNSPSLAELFYSTMLSDDEAKDFLDHDLVNTRLRKSMQRWLQELFQLNTPDADVIFDHQVHVGEVHARIHIPITLVIRGAKLLKQGIASHLVNSALSRIELVTATHYVAETIDLAMDAMTDAFISDMEKYARADESYRMFAIGQNMVAERERQRGALLDWAHKLLLGLLAESKEGDLPRIHHSEFGMWLHHKASILFQSAPELENIRQRIELIELSISSRLLEAKQNATDAKQLMKELETGISEIKFLLGSLFDRHIEEDGGRDTLTQLLNRRFLPSILSREIVIARKNNVSFALLLLDLDFFKKINDTFGHKGGDMVLQQSAELISASVRAGDFIFRYGGEEVLVVLVEVDTQIAMTIAENIRKRFEANLFNVGHNATTNITVSIGVATVSIRPVAY